MYVILLSSSNRTYDPFAIYCLWLGHEITVHSVCISIFLRTVCQIISYPLFAGADTGIYPHAALQYHARPKAKRGIAMLSVDKFPVSAEANKG